MKKFMSIMLGLSLVLGAATVSFAGEDKDTKKTTKAKTKKTKTKKTTETKKS